MNFDPNSVEYQKWCKKTGISPNSMAQVANDKLFFVLNQLMEDVDSLKQPVVKAGNTTGEEKITLDVKTPGGPENVWSKSIEEMGDEELKGYITLKGGSFHHMNKREKLIEIAKAL